MERLDVVEQVTTCTRCPLVNDCRGPVSFTGQSPAKVAVIGEAPGGEEDRQGRPFVGPAGKWLRTRLTEVGIDPESLSYMNVVSCFPNGTPKPEHIEACSPNRYAQLDFLDPKWILLVGGVALSAWRPDLKVSQTHGRPLLLEGRVAFSVYHPSAAMRRVSYDRDLRSDLARFRSMMDKGPDKWSTFVPDQCVNRCNDFAVWHDENALGWCEKHLPPAGKERLRFVDNEYRTIAGKPLDFGPPSGGILTCADGKSFKVRCDCSLHPHQGHPASPLP